MHRIREEGTTMGNGSDGDGRSRAFWDRAAREDALWHIAAAACPRATVELRPFGRRHTWVIVHREAG